MIAVIMAGGKATRFGNRVEKALLELMGKTLLEISLDKLRSFSFDEIYVSVSPNTPRTIKLCERFGAKVQMTSGADYHQDIYALLGSLGNFISLNVDSPFVSSTDIARLLESIVDTSMSVAVPRKLVDFPVDEQSEFQIEGARYIWIGLNYVTPSEKMGFIESNNRLGALNINTRADLELAEKYARRYRLGDGLY